MFHLPRVNKPVTLAAFGLVTQDNAPFFVPVNKTQAPFGSDQGMSGYFLLSDIKCLLFLLGCSLKCCTCSYTALWCNRRPKR